MPNLDRYPYIPRKKRRKKPTLAQLEGWSLHHDVTYDLQRWYADDMKKRKPRLLAIQRQGRESEAIYHLKKADQDGRMFGYASWAQEIGKATELAKLASFSSLHELAKKHNLWHLLRGGE